MARKKTFKCPHCGKDDMVNERGLKIHVSRMHPDRSGKEKKGKTIKPQGEENSSLWDYSKNDMEHTNMQVRLIKGTKYPEEFPRGKLKPSYRKAIQKGLDEAYKGMKQPEIEVFWAVITVALAKLLFDYRAPNRKPGSVIKEYVEELLEERWGLTGQPIILDEDDRLIDGQQRMASIIETGIPMEVLVVRGVSSKNFEFMDTGMNRNSRHMLECHRDADGNRIENPTEISAALNLAIRYCRAVEDKIPYLARNKVRSRLPLNAFKIHPSFSKMAIWSKEMKKELSALGLSSGMVICSMFYTHETNAKKSGDFWEGLATGIDLKKTSPVLALRSFLIKEIVSLKEKPKPSSEWALEATIASWNMYVKGNDCRKPIVLDEEKEVFPQFADSRRVTRGLLRSIGE